MEGQWQTSLFRLQKLPFALVCSGISLYLRLINLIARKYSPWISQVTKSHPVPKNGPVPKSLMPGFPLDPPEARQMSAECPPNSCGCLPDIRQISAESSPDARWIIVFTFLTGIWEWDETWERREFQLS